MLITGITVPIALLLTLLLTLADAGSHHHNGRTLAIIQKQRSDLIPSLAASGSGIVQTRHYDEDWVNIDDEDEDDEADLEAWGEVDEDDLEDATAIFDEEEENFVASNSTHKRSSSLLKRGSIPGGFKGTQKGFGSWFRANNGGDYTNGKSWCGIKYNNNSPLFAAKFGIMSPTHAKWGKNTAQWHKDGKKYCGLQAKVWWTDGKKGHKRSKYLYIGDAFADEWVKTKGSIDILKAAWSSLHGGSTSSKNVVLNNVQWKLTGKRSKKYRFHG